MLVKVAIIIVTWKGQDLDSWLTDKQEVTKHNGKAIHFTNSACIYLYANSSYTT